MSPSSSVKRASVRHGQKGKQVEGSCGSHLEKYDLPAGLQVSGLWGGRSQTARGVHRVYSNPDVGRACCMLLLVV